MNPKAALIVVDVQNDFCPGGALAVERGDEIIKTINALMPYFGTVVLTQDWHPQGHVSFTHWPEHCVQGTYGAAFHAWLNTDKAHLIIRKGMHKQVDSYSAFMDENGWHLGLAGLLHARHVTDVYVCGLALDYCVLATARDCAEQFSHLFRPHVIVDASRAIQQDQIYWDTMGIGVAHSSEWLLNERKDDGQ